LSRRDRALGRVVTVLPNHKFGVTRSVALEADLVSGDGDAAFIRANAAFVWNYYARVVRLAARRSRDRLLDRVTAVGEHHLRTAEAHARGVILLSVHLGDFDLAGAWLAARRGLTPVVVSRPLLPRWREATFSGIRRRCGVVVRDANSTALASLEDDLNQGRAILAMLDRRPPGPTSTLKMLGKPAVASLAVATLAARTRAPLLPAATWRSRRGSVIAWFGAPTVALRVTEAVTAMAAAAETLSTLIRDHPEQWHVPSDLRQLAWSGIGESHSATRAQPVPALKSANASAR